MMNHPALDRQMLCSVLHGMLRSFLWNRNGWLAAEYRFAESDLPVSEILKGCSDSELNDLARRFAALFGCQDAAIQLLAARTCREWVEHLVACGALRSPQVDFHSSGSTGAPTACPQSLVVLWQEVEQLGRLAEGSLRLVSVVPHHHIYGFLFGVLLARHLEIPVQAAPPFPFAGFLSDLKEGDLIIAFPAFWEGLAGLGLTLPVEVRGVTSTGPCSVATIKSLRELGLAAMLEVYGSSETSGVGFRWDPEGPYTLFDYWQPTVLHSMSPDALMRRQSDGVLSEPILLPDEVEWFDQRSFFPLRRKDKAVQVAGINVYPQKVADLLKQHPDVADCLVRLMRPDEGLRLKAFVVPADGAPCSTTLRNDLSLWCREHLQSVEQPRTFTFGARLPVQIMGKPADW